MYTKTKLKADKILELYNQGMTVTEIIENIGEATSKKTVKKALASFGIDYTAELARKKGEMPDKVVELYKIGRSLLEIEAELKLTYTTVRDVLADKGIVQRSLSQQTTIRHGSIIDESVFDELNEGSMYWMGLLYADGHVHRSGWYGVELTLHMNDIELLYKYGQFLKSNRVPKKVNKSNCAKFIIGSKIIHTRLREFGFEPDKSYTGKPHEDLKHSRHFWRGVIDGDGSLYASKNWNADHGFRRVLSLCGTEATCIGFKEFVIENGIVTKANVRKIPDESTWVISYDSKIAEQVAKLLYIDSKIYMERKYKKYLEYFSGTE